MLRRPAERGRGAAEPERAPHPAAIQPRLTVGGRHDIFEREAHRIADRVTRMPASGTPVAVRRMGTEPASRVDRQGQTAPPVVNEVLDAPGQPLPAAVRSFMEPRFGHDFSRVRVHRGRRAAESARALRAAAFTSRSHIVFGPGRFAPETGPGQCLLAHELTHVVQQSAHRRGPAEDHSTLAPVPAGRLIARAPEDEAAAPSEEAAPMPSNARFAGNRILERILSGDIPVLSDRHNGRGGAVSRVQQALVALGFELPMHRVDGSYGTETEEAIRQFRARYGPSDGNQLDGATLAVLDRVAPPPGESHEHTVDYDRLLADRRLDVTVALGATDEVVRVETRPGHYEKTTRPVEDLEAERFRSWMTTNGFELELLGLSGNEYWKATRSITWTSAEGTVQTREVDIWINLVVPGTGAAREYREGLTSDEITLYSGHARYGSGPDFDAKDKALENFRIGIDRALSEAGRPTRAEIAERHHVALDEEHDLVDMVNSGDFDPDRYRVLFFNACTSLAYLDEIREQVGGPGNVDFIGTRRPSLFSPLESAVGVPEVQRFLEGIMAAESVESILAALDEMQRSFHSRGGRAFPRGGLWSSSGLGDNPRAP